MEITKLYGNSCDYIDRET